MIEDEKFFIFTLEYTSNKIVFLFKSFTSQFK